MEQRYSLITLATRDLARSTAFFEGLGWKRSVKDSPGIAFFQCGSAALALYPREAFFSDLGIADDGSMSAASPSPTTPARERKSTPSSRRWRGWAPRSSSPATTSSGAAIPAISATLNGHLWEVAWNPGFPIDETGAVHLPD